MTKAESLGTVWVCVDCYMAHHGLLEDDDTPAPDREPLSLIGEGVDVTAGLSSYAEHAEDCLLHITGDREQVPGDYECDCEHITFTWSPCQGCGSTLGGSREALTLWKREG